MKSPEHQWSFSCKFPSIQWKLYSYCDSTVWFGGRHIKRLDPYITNNYSYIDPLKRVFPSPSLIMQTTLLHSLCLLSFSCQSESIFTLVMYNRKYPQTESLIPDMPSVPYTKAVSVLMRRISPTRLVQITWELCLVLHVHTGPPHSSLRLWLPFHRLPCFHDSWWCHTELLWRTRIELAKQDQRDVCQLLYQWPVTLCGLVWHKTSTAGISARKPSRK